MSDSKWTVEPEAGGARLVAFLAAADRLASRGGAVRALERGKVFVNDEEATRADAGRRLAAGDRVRVWMDRPGSARRRAFPHRAGALAVLYEDDDLMAINKPAGVLAVPLVRAGEVTPSVLGLLKEHFRSDRRRGPFVVHRIDRDTSGIVLFAKSGAAQARVKEQFRHREPERTYQAVVYGHPAPPAGTWRDRLAWDDRMLMQRVVPARDPRGRDAISEYRTVEPYRDASLIEVRLVTGKQHQIRVQAALCGHPLVGERRYTPDTADSQRIPFPRQALHACRLTLDHPSTRRRLTIEAPMPADLATLLDRLRRSARR